ncbi:RluA family pseudouridine synthase [Planococcus sp. ISL-109]|uniref:RluA family pseudouridine synthase n=1 Tax=Planococcus sp. ISL-109 TaxID=2819166 RepID=UPI001BE835E3|nr:RluA family pseudouridine synthase [Planococcus sp. ISL-109]MBT2581744.1 RluA family pseudouridine synthase [Planococcus sp. ISL-109]
MKAFQVEFTATERGLLRNALQNYGISKRTLASVKYSGGHLLVNGSEVTVRHPLEIGDAVTVVFPKEANGKGLAAENGPLVIVYEDAALLIVEKPPGQNTIPSRNQPLGSLANIVAGHFEQHGVPSTLHIATRLDKDTSGLVCIAKNRHIHHLLSVQQQEKRMNRRYEAFVHGEVTDEKAIITAPIGRKEASIIEREVRADGKFAETEMDLIQTMKGASHIRLKLNTGRTHQIRVHLAHIGHPLLGDDLYGGGLGIIARQALHCTELQLDHPLSGERMEFTSALADDMHALI